MWRAVMDMRQREKIVVIIFAAIIIAATGLFLYDSLAKKVPHVTMVSSFDIRHVDSLYGFKDKRIDTIKVTTETSLTYTMERDKSGIHVQIRDEENNLLTETVCGEFRIYYVPESWSPDKVELQSCASGEGTYTLGSIQ